MSVDIKTYAYQIQVENVDVDKFLNLINSNFENRINFWYSGSNWKAYEIYDLTEEELLMLKLSMSSKTAFVLLPKTVIRNRVESGFVTNYN